MNIRKCVCSLLLIFTFLTYQVEETDAIFIIKAALIAKAIIAAKIIKGLWFARGGGGFGGLGGFGGGGAGGTGSGGFLGWGRRRRDAEKGVNITNEDVEQIFSIVSNIDEDLCMARIICEIHASKNRKQFGQLGDGIQRIFKNYNLTTAHARSPVIKYKQAAILGSISDSNVCSEVYSICRLKPDQIDRVIDTANNVDW
uniref:Uncharacterized protein n=1 Tax=Strigamia maritima TaxID=126957 RepID=T1JKP1_STRMM